MKLLFTIPIGEADKGGDHYWRKTPGAPAEDALHHLFRHYHVLGEWFDIMDRINIRECREYFGSFYRTGSYEVERYKAIMERRKTNERDPLEAAD